MSEEQRNIIDTLKRLLPNFPIKKAWLFGSYATGENTTKSDIDLLVSYERSATFSLFTIGHIISELSISLGRSVDLVEEGRLLPFAQKNVDATKILIYERGA